MKHFQTLTSEQQAIYQQRANIKKRSPALRQAWENKEHLRKESQTKTIKEIALEYNINERSAYRIINGK